MPKRTTETSITTEISIATDNSLNDGNGFWDELEPLIDGKGRVILTKAPTKAPTIEEKSVSEKKASEESTLQTAQDKSDIEAKIPTSNEASNATPVTYVWSNWKKMPSKKDQMITNNIFVDHKTKYFLWSKEKKKELIDLAKVTLLTEKKRKKY